MENPKEEEEESGLKIKNQIKDRKMGHWDGVSRIKQKALSIEDHKEEPSNTPRVLGLKEIRIASDSEAGKLKRDRSDPELTESSRNGKSKPRR